MPRETEATCGSCAMVAGQARAPQDARQYFDPVTRCCTYIPAIPNYLVGRILADGGLQSLHGGRTVAARLRETADVTPPLGFARPAVHALLYSRGTKGFGRSRVLRCPYHLDDGSCGIWGHRPSVCATWYCKHVRGALGVTFWKALSTLLRTVEYDLARWCLLEVGFDARRVSQLFPAPGKDPADAALHAYQLDGTADPRQYAALWGEWAGREREFFGHCGRLVGDLNWRDVTGIVGPAARLLAGAVRKAFADLKSDEVPARLRAGGFVVLGAERRAALVVAYSDYDPLRLPAELLGVLPYFDGSPVDETLRTIAKEKKLRLDGELLRRLVDFNILVPASDGR